MKKYLSFGGGVNSVAMMLMLLDQKEDFEAIFVNHGCDWPETYDYFDMFQGWLEEQGHQKITVLRPNVSGFDNLYDYCLHYKITPSFFRRFCTDKFKVRVIQAYIETPCFMLLGIDSGEQKRAKFSHNKGVENRFPLIENDIDRESCKQIILDHNLPVPMLSGCFFCPFQRVGLWKRLRMEKPELFCKAKHMENVARKSRNDRGKTPITISASGKRLSTIVDEDQLPLFEQDQYPPCQCGL